MASQRSLPMILFMLAALTASQVVCLSSRHKVDGRANVASIKDFGGVGDGTTLNTDAFREAIANLSAVASNGGSALVLPAGRWLTGPFNLSSHFTLYLEKHAVLLAFETNASPIIGGGHFPRARLPNFIMGTNLTDVTITGQNGTIDGQRDPLWDQFLDMNLTRGYLMEFLYSHHVTISNVTLVNSPTRFVHLANSTNVTVHRVTILNPVDSHNTDPIIPGLSKGAPIEVCAIINGKVVEAFNNVSACDPDPGRGAARQEVGVPVPYP